MAKSRSVTASAAACLFASMIASPATAQDPKWFVHVGPAQLSLADKADIRAGGTPLADAGLDTDPQYTAVIEVGRMVAPSFAVAVTMGLPPVAKFDGTGTLEGLGRLGSVRYGPGALTVQWHPMKGDFQPYVGAGATYMHIFSTKDAALTDVEVDDDIGPLIQVGAHYFFDGKNGVFLDVKKGWLRTRATANLGPTPIEADLKLDPLVLNAGLALRF